MINHFVMYGEPRGKQRPRVANGHAYTPQKTREYEALMAYQYQTQCKGWFGKDTRVQMKVIAWYGIPKSASKAMRSRMLSGEIRPTRSPDCDNVLKIVADSLNKIAFYDDSQIDAMVIEKRYSDTPRVEVWLTDEGLNAIEGSV